MVTTKSIEGLKSNCCKTHIQLKADSIYWYCTKCNKKCDGLVEMKNLKIIPPQNK